MIKRDQSDSAVYATNYMKKGFTLVEAIITISIIGLLTIIAVTALGAGRQRSRDANRVAAVNQISKALETYYLHNGIYPTAITPGQNLASGSTVYLSPVPSNPTPRTDGGCADQNFIYTSKVNNQDYELKFCLSRATSGYPSGTNVIAQGGVVTPYRPDTMSGLLLWLRADWLNYTDGDTVATWTDSSGNNNHANAATANNRPTFKTNVVNGKPALRYDGNSDLLTLTSALTTVRQIFIVMKWDNQVIDYVPILGGATTYDFHGTPGSSYVVWSSYSSACVTGGSGWNNGTLLTATTIPKDRTAFQLIELQTSCNATVANISTDRGTMARSIHGDIAEVILYNRTLSTTERQNVERYLKTKYNLTVAGI